MDTPDWNNVMLTPWLLASEVAAQATYKNPFFTAPLAELNPVLVSGTSFFDLSKKIAKPYFGIEKAKSGTLRLAITEELALKKPFCHLRHFVRTPEIKNDPTVLIFAPLSGHSATLMRETVATMLPDHDVYVTDWIDAALVPLAAGSFGIDECIDYAMNFISALGPEVHVIAIGDIAPCVLAAITLLADSDDPSQPKSMTFIGAPINTQIAKSNITATAADQPVSWFEDNFIKLVPFYYPGAYRTIYPGQFEIKNPLKADEESNVNLQYRAFQDLVRGDGASEEQHRSFFEKDYLSVINVPSEYYLGKMERIYQKNELANRTMRWHYRLIKPELITKTALLTIEGDLDDVAPPGQTRWAHDLCSGLEDQMKVSYLQIGVGHYGLFQGHLWRTSIQPLIQTFLRTIGGAPTYCSLENHDAS